MKQIKLPQIKKELKHFISDESGGTTKSSIIKTGIALGGLMALSESVAAHHVESYSHSNSLALSLESDAGVGRHSHHGQHSSGC